MGLSTPDGTAFGLVVYASQGRLLRPTQDSLPVAGQALPDGLSTHKIPMRGFKIVSLHLYPPLPSFAWRNGGDRRKFEPLSKAENSLRKMGGCCEPGSMFDHSSLQLVEIEYCRPGKIVLGVAGSGRCRRAGGVGLMGG